MRVTVDQIQKMSPMEPIHQTFLERDDIRCLSPEEQESRWQIHLHKIGTSMEFLAQFECIGVLSVREE